MIRAQRSSPQTLRFCIIAPLLYNSAELIRDESERCYGLTPMTHLWHRDWLDGLVAHILDLSGRGNEDVKQICSTALNQVPPDMVQLDDKMVKVLVSLLTVTGSLVIGDGSNAVSEPSVHDLKPWSLQSASIAENPVNIQSSWVNDICQDFEVSNFCAPHLRLCGLYLFQNFCGDWIKCCGA